MEQSIVEINCLNVEQIKQLEEWTRLKCGEVLFDSNKDNWAENTSVFNDRIIGKKQIVFLVESEDGEQFGYYLHTEIIEEYYFLIKTDTKSFEFNLESKDNRLPGPMKFEIKKKISGGYKLFKKSDDVLITLGDIVLSKENKKHESFCCSHRENRFDYH